MRRLQTPRGNEMDCEQSRMNATRTEKTRTVFDCLMEMQVLTVKMERIPSGVIHDDRV